MTVLSEVFVVKGKGAECLRVVGKKFIDGLFPILLEVVCLHVPRIVGNAIEGDFRRLGVFHRVRHETRKFVGDVQIVAVCGSQRDVVAHEVGHWEIPPDIGLALNALVDPVGAFFVDAMNHGVARPHDVDALVEFGAQRTQIALLLVDPRAVVFRWAHHERCHIWFLLNEVVVNIVEQFGLLVGLGAFSPDVVEEHGKGPHSQFVHLLKFGHQGIAVFVVPFNVNAWMDGPVEAHAVALGMFCQFLDAQAFLLGIWHTPMSTVVRVVFRTIYIYVHLVAAVEVKLA